MAAEEEKTKDLKTETEARDEEEEGGGSKEMTPWEQHASVISIPRFDYSAPSSLLHRSHSGFLITCSIKREKSATKEAMAILAKYVASLNDDNSLGSEISDVNASAKRQKICIEHTCARSENGIESKDSSEETVVGSEPTNEDLGYSKRNNNSETNFVLSLVKLTRSGLLLLVFPKENSPDTTNIVSNVFQSLESGNVRSPLWCHRIFPIQATCILDEKELQETVSKLVRRFVDDQNNKLSQPLKFAAGYNRRGLEETAVKVSKYASADPDQHALLDRSKCFNVVAAGVKDVSDSVVDLKSPELCVLVELLPLSRVPNGSLVAAVSVLPQDLVSTKPRLCIKPLVSDPKARKGKN